MTDSSMSTWCTGLAVRPYRTDAGADAAQRERGPDDRREADRLDEVQRLFERPRAPAGRHVDADRLHRVAELQAILGHFDRCDRRANQLDAVPPEHTPLVQLDGQVQRGLTADGGQQRIGPFARDDLFDDVGGERLDVGAIGELGVGHDRRRVAVHQHDLEPLGAQRLARLRPRVVELGRLPDDNRTRADDEHAFQIGASGHFCLHLTLGLGPLAFGL
jgi:hypothetical protein